MRRPGELRAARYVFALSAVAAAFFLRQGLIRLLGAGLPPYLTFYPVVMVVALTCGLGPGIFATLSAALLADYWMLPPLGELRIAQLNDLVALTIFVGTAVFISVVADLYRRSRLRVEVLERQAAGVASEQAPQADDPALVAVAVVFLLSLSILMAAGWFSVRNMAAEMDFDRRTEQAYLDLAQLDGLVSALKDVETGQRGYTITGNESYLEPYNQAFDQVETGLAQFKRSTRDNPRLQQRLVTLDPVVREKLAEVRGQVELRRSKGFAAASAAMADDRGKALMDEIRRQVAQAKVEEERLLKAISATKEVSGNRAYKSLLAGNVLSFLLLGSVFFYLREEIVRRIGAEIDLRRQRDSLEEGVAARTAALSLSNEQLKREIEDRRQAEETLRASEERLFLFIEHAPVALAMFDRGMRYLCVSRRWRIDYDLGERALFGISHYDVLPEIPQQWREAHRRGLAGEVLQAEGDRFVRADGSVQWLRWEIRPWYDAAGEVGGIIIFAEDITHLKQSEERVQASLREKEVLLKEIHHRVKNNMQIISSLVNLQADTVDNPDVRVLFRDVRDRVRSMALVHEKLYHSDDLARVPFDEYVRSLLNYLWHAYALAHADVKLTLDLEPVSLSVEKAVPCGLMLNELVTNALKHAFSGRSEGEVTVSLHLDREGVVSLSVGDDGVGLPGDPDWRAAGSLGMRLLQMLAGQLNAAVELNRSGGTLFTVTFTLPEAAKDGESSS
jgi:PAS domain S-box-containing protein